MNDARVGAPALAPAGEVVGDDPSAGRLDAAGVRARRPAKPRHDPWRPIAHRVDVERGLAVERRDVLTVFLTGAECPFTCLFCDLWRHTLEGPTPPGALPAQLDAALRAHPDLPRDAAIKLYNASNFFDRRAVPEVDHAGLAARCAPFSRVTVESHPRLLGDRCEAFSDAIEGRLEVGMGLETVHPVALGRLKDGMSLNQFDDAVRWTTDRGIGVRAFVLVGLPWVPAAEFTVWAARSAAHALAAGADRVSLIPLRADSGSMADLARSGAIEPVALTHVEAALRLALEENPSGRIVEADLWDAERFAPCPSCATARVESLARMNRSQRPVPATPCECGDD